MFQAFDNPGPGRPLGRAQWMALLARAPLGLLESALHEHATRPARWLRAPETGLMMVQGRAGGSGERFNLGEVTVTRCALRWHTLGATAADGTAPVGVAYVLGRLHRHAELAAQADALLQQGSHRDTLEQTLLEPVRQHLARQMAEQQARVQSTRVDFFTVAREAGGADNDEDGA